VNRQPKKWIAVVLGFFLAPLGFLYVGNPKLASLPILVGLGLSLSFFFIPGFAAGHAFSVVQFGLGVLWAVWVYIIATRNTGEKPVAWYSRWYGLVALAACFLAGVVLLRAFTYEPYRVPSTSMTPTLPVGSNILVQKWGYGHYTTFGLRLATRPISASLERGDIVAFDFPRDPGQSYLHRIIGLPGDKIVYRDKHVFVNGVDVRGKRLADYLDDRNLQYVQRYEEKLGRNVHDILIKPEATPWLGDSAYTLPSQCTIDHEVIACDIPAGNYFVMGDNRDNSLDSRYWGFVAAKAIIGKVVHVVPG
jgi:signal peptidase I